jgi:predicted Zn-dependent protease
MGVLVGISAAATLLAGMVIFVPEVLARRMPMSWERKLGAAYELPIEANRCAGAKASLDALIDRIDPQARADGFTLELVDLDVANAVALPGGRMVIFSGLLKEMEKGDAVAGVVAHEIAHVRRRHVAAGVIRDLGLGTIVTLMGGGAVAGNAGGLLSLKFTRSAEAEADEDAIAMLRTTGIDPRPTAHLFEQFAKENGDGFGVEFLQSHPLSRERAKRFAASFDKSAAYRPALDSSALKALEAACAD